MSFAPIDEAVAAAGKTLDPGLKTRLDALTADYRLGELDDWTLGVKYGRVLRGDSEWNVKLEYLRQSGRSNSPPGAPTAFDYFPSVDALMVQVGCGF